MKTILGIIATVVAAIIVGIGAEIWTLSGRVYGLGITVEKQGKEIEKVQCLSPKVERQGAIINIIHDDVKAIRSYLLQGKLK